jgi:hypothetical protein
MSASQCSDAIPAQFEFLIRDAKHAPRFYVLTCRRRLPFRPDLDSERMET